MLTQPRNLLNLDDVPSWPDLLREALEGERQVLIDWYTEAEQRSSRTFDRAIERTGRALQVCTLKGWHCTRLTDREITNVVAGGLSLLSRASLENRIAVLEADGTISGKIGTKLRANHLVDEANRTGRLWFCFFPPRRQDESGIGPFFRRWGGEALYGMHEGDAVTGPLLTSIGVPCVIEAMVPAEDLQHQAGLCCSMAVRYAHHLGVKRAEVQDHENCSGQPLAARHILDIHRFPGQSFVELTGCAAWLEPLHQ